MHRYIAVTAAVSATAGLITLGLQQANAGPIGNGTHSRATSPTSVRFIDRVGPASNHDIDLGQPGFSVGDQQTFRDRLMRSGHRVGTSTGVSEITALGGGRLSAVLTVTVLLRHGTLTLQGAVTEVLADGPSPTHDMAVTGGTGIYAGAGGHCHSVTFGHGDDGKVACELVYPR
jgi:hypothetical protein